MREYAKREILEIIEEFIEKQSAKIPGRAIFNKMVAQTPRRKISARQRAKNSEFVWKNGGKSVGRASRVPPSGFEKAVEFCIGGCGRNRTYDLVIISDAFYQADATAPTSRHGVGVWIGSPTAKLVGGGLTYFVGAGGIGAKTSSLLATRSTT